MILFREDKEAARAAVAELRAIEVRSEARQVDVREYDAVSAAIDELTGTGESLAILVNCAGITADRTVGKLPLADWQAVIDTNLTGSFITATAVLPHMRAAGYGRIVNISSIIAQTGNRGQTNYAAAKAGMLGFTKSLARETAQHDITVNAICPGFIDTDMLATVPSEIIETICRRIPKGRLGRPEEVAYAVAFLVEPRAAYITGQVINVNGGEYM
jgi:NAD(P)-dependent dehydrogenase (short-subunit alcohol dehydrogenase family)